MECGGVARYPASRWMKVPLVLAVVAAWVFLMLLAAAGKAHGKGSFPLPTRAMYLLLALDYVKALHPAVHACARW